MWNHAISHRLFHLQMRKHISTYIKFCPAVDKEKGIEKSRKKWYNIYIKTVVKR